MDNQKSEGAERKIDEIQSEDRVPECQDSPKSQFDGRMLETAGEGVGPKPELGSPVASRASSECSECSEEMAEELYLGRVQGKTALLLHAHLKICPHCRQVYEETVQFVDAIRAAAETLESVDGSTVN